jgi:hypothetical protein
VERRVPPAADSLDVEVVGGLIQQEDVGALLEHAGEVDAVALAAGDLRCPLLALRWKRVGREVWGMRCGAGGVGCSPRTLTACLPGCSEGSRAR